MAGTEVGSGEGEERKKRSSAQDLVQSRDIICGCAARATAQHYCSDFVGGRSRACVTFVLALPCARYTIRLFISDERSPAEIEYFARERFATRAEAFAPKRTLALTPRGRGGEEKNTLGCCAIYFAIDKLDTAYTGLDVLLMR